MILWECSATMKAFGESSLTVSSKFAMQFLNHFLMSLGRIVKYLCLSVKIAKSKNEKFSVVYAMQFGSESFNL